MATAAIYVRARPKDEGGGLLMDSRRCGFTDPLGGRLTTVRIGLLAGAIGLFVLAASVAAQSADQPQEDAPGVVWRLVRGGED